MDGRRWLHLISCIVMLIALIFLGVPWLRVATDSSTPSRSVGRVGAGRLEHGHPLPPWGKGYRTYSLIGAALGRQYVHGDVRDILIGAFAARALIDSELTHVVGETAVRRGGRFHGHRTHQNGLSVDLFMPLRERSGARATLSTWPWRGLGYWHEFDEHGREGRYSIDFEELASLLLTIDQQARARGAAIERIIIAPEYVPLLLATDAGRQFARLPGHLSERLTRRPVWVRHDEHVHIDFLVAPAAH